MAIQNGFIQIIQDEKRDYQYEEAMKTLRTNIQSVSYTHLTLPTT